jgi:hypothetical protein
VSDKHQQRAVRFTIEELLYTRFPSRISDDIDLDPCKGGKTPTLLKIYEVYVLESLVLQVLSGVAIGETSGAAARKALVLISGFRCDVDEICALLGYYAASCCNCLPTFRGNVSVPSSRVKRPIRCPKTSVNNYHTTPRNIPEDCRSQALVCLPSTGFN